jgi:hypothetical protein
VDHDLSVTAGGLLMAHTRITIWIGGGYRYWDKVLAWLKARL